MPAPPAPAAPVSTGSDLDAFVRAFDDFARAAKRARHRQSGSGDGELTVAQYSLLAPLLDASEAPGVRELAEAAGVSSPTATRMLDGLERKGLVVRERCERDRRAVRLSLTASGVDAVRAQRRRQLALRRAIFESLDGRERRMAAQVLERLARAFEEASA
jgi:MarR family transcriptional regulator, organic hydroperoxide resistance regulator